MPRYSIGIDFGTTAARALLVDVETGDVAATSVCAYDHGVIDAVLPVEGDPVSLGPDWALHDPDDYLRALRRVIPGLLTEGAAEARDVIGVGIDATSCTLLPVLRDGTALCTLPAYRRNPHAWVKLWKHHAAQTEADVLNAVARDRAVRWLARYGGRISSEWFFPKVLQVLHEAPEVYEAAGYFIEVADWLVWQLTAVPQAGACTAGYKALWARQEGFPSADFFAAVEPRLEQVVAEKLPARVGSVGTRAGVLTPLAARWTGLHEGTPVAVGVIDAHAAVPGAGVAEVGRMVMIMGTSLCHMLLSYHGRTVKGIAGVVEGGIVPDLFGYEAGQPSLGDTFAWATQLLGQPFEQLERAAARLQPAQSGLLALDWWNGNRSLLDDAALSGLLVGTTLHTTPAEVYRALMEAAALGTRVILEAFEEHGVVVDELVACGGIPGRSPLLMQIYADITGRPIQLAAAEHASALGAAIHGAAAAGHSHGGYDAFAEAVACMTHDPKRTYTPQPAHRPVYDQLYDAYRQLYHHFGETERVMHTLRQLRAEALRAAERRP